MREAHKNSMRTLTLAPLTAPPRAYDFVAFDCEGDGSADGFRLAATWDASGGRIFRRPRDLADFLFSHRHREARILAANLEYDWAVAFQPFNSHHNVLLNHGRWLRATYADNSRHSYTAWDIQRIAPLSVAAMGAVVGLKKYPTPPQLIDDAYHHAQHFTCDDHHRNDCIECYCLRDAQIVYAFARLYQSELNALGGQMKMTAASCAMDLFRRRFLRDEIEPTFERTNEFARAALHGGRVENFKCGTDNFVNAYDFNSLYPSVMLDLAVGRPGTYHRLRSTLRLGARLDKVGIFRGTVEIPRSYVPPLGVRVSARNYFVVGRARGSWTFSELRHALEHGARVVETEEILYADESVKLFGEFVRVLYARKLDYQRADDPRAGVTKLLLNSPWGKFAQQSKTSLQTLIVPRAPYSLSDFDGDEPAVLAGHEIFLRDIDPRAQSAHVHVPWAAEIAAQARVALHEKLIEQDTALYYCDTDSIHTARTLKTGDGLGELKLANHFQRVTYLAPKEYGGLNDRNEFVAHAKGIPPDQQREFLLHGSARFKRPQHILEAIRARGRIAEWRWVEKQRRAAIPCRDHPALDDYNNYFVDSRAWDVEALPDDA